jgi:hypothetical protein
LGGDAEHETTRLGLPQEIEEVVHVGLVVESGHEFGLTEPPQMNER